MKYIGTLKSKIIISLILGIIFSIAISIYSATHTFCYPTPTNPCGGISSITAREILILWFLGFTVLFTLLTIVDFISRKFAKPQNFSSVPNDLPKNSAKTDFLIAAILILGGVLLLYATAGKPVIKNDNAVNPTSQSSPILTQTGPSASLTPTQISLDETANWKTYSNARYTYTIKYPTNWFVDTIYSENDFTQRGPVEDNEFIGGDTGFSNYPNASGYSMENPAPSDLYSVSLMVYRVASNISYDQFISSKHFGYDKKENISINGISAVRLTGVTTDHPVGVTVVNTLVKVGNKMFVFNYSGNPIPQQIKDTANKLINSFTAK